MCLDCWRVACCAFRIQLLLLFSYELVATMQTVVTGEAPITLEWNITTGKRLGRKTSKQYDGMALCCMAWHSVIYSPVVAVLLH